MSEAQDRFLIKKWGVFNHYLYGMLNGGPLRNPSGKKADWDTTVNEFDVELLAKNLHEMGAGYYFITIMQGGRQLCAPNEAFDRICGTKPGEACSTRDLPMDLYYALKKYDIDLYLYFTGDGPHLDKECGEKMGMGEPRIPVTDKFINNWSSVLKEYAERYKDKVKGWWIDGCYDFLGYNDDYLEYYHRAIKSGNPDGMMACNRTGTSEMAPGSSKEEFTCGEQLDFDKLPESRYINGVQGHLLIPLGVNPENGDKGHTWCMPGIKRTKEEVANFIKQANKIGIPVTVDIAIYRDGSFDSEQLEFMKYVGRNV